MKESCFRLAHSGSSRDTWSVHSKKPATQPCTESAPDSSPEVVEDTAAEDSDLLQAKQEYGGSDVDPTAESLPRECSSVCCLNELQAY